MNIGPYSCRDYPDAPPGEAHGDICPDCRCLWCECPEKELCIACDEPVDKCQCDEGLTECRPDPLKGLGEAA